jgi:hypothetical protein
MFLFSWKFFHHKFAIADMVVLQCQKCVLRAFMVSKCNGSSTEILQIQNRGKLKYKYSWMMLIIDSRFSTHLWLLLDSRFYCKENTQSSCVGLTMCLLHLQERILTFFYLVDSMGQWMNKEKPVMNAGESSKVWNKNPIISLLCTTPVWKRAQSLQEEEEDIRAQTTTESGNMTA